MAGEETQRAGLLGFVMEQVPTGRTALVPAMRTAFLMNASRIVLLSDGLGNLGGDSRALLRDAREAIRGGVRVDTIGLGAIRTARSSRPSPARAAASTRPCSQRSTPVLVRASRPSGRSAWTLAAAARSNATAREDASIDSKAGAPAGLGAPGRRAGGRGRRRPPARRGRGSGGLITCVGVQASDSRESIVSGNRTARIDGLDV